MAYRHRPDIVSQILETVYDHDGYHDDDRDGISQTKIMYGVNRSSGLVKYYLIALSVHGLLFNDSAMRRYHITENGIRFLELYSKLDDLIEDEMEQKEQVQF